MTLRVFVIGGGAMGLSAAIELARRGIGVTMADRGQQAGGSSWAGAGILSTLPPWGYTEDVSRLALAGMRGWPEWATMLESLSPVSPEFWSCGMEVMLTDTAGKPDPSVTNTSLGWCRAHQLPAEARPGSIWLPEVSQVRNPRLLASLKAAITALGGKLLPGCEVTGIKTAQGRIIAAHTTQEDQHADQFVLATGAWSGLPLDNALPVPHIRPMRGQMLLYPPGSHALAHIILRDGFYLVPRQDGHLLAGSTVEDAGFDSVTTPDALKTLHESACQLLPSLKNHAPIKSWAGLRPGSPHNLPIIDRHPDFENLWIHTGHFRYGVTMAPASSRLLVEQMTGTPPFLDPAPYSLQAAAARNWQEASAC